MNRSLKQKQFFEKKSKTNSFNFEKKKILKKNKLFLKWFMFVHNIILIINQKKWVVWNLILKQRRFVWNFFQSSSHQFWHDKKNWFWFLLHSNELQLFHFWYRKNKEFSVFWMNQNRKINMFKIRCHETSMT